MVEKLAFPAGIGHMVGNVRKTWPLLVFGYQSFLTICLEPEFERIMDEFAEIVLLERGPYVSFANCGLPYHIGGVIPRRASLLVATPQKLRASFDVDARVNSEVTAVDRAAKTVTVRDLESGQVYQEHELRFERQGDDLIIEVPGAKDLTLEKRAMAIKGDLFEDIYGMRIRLEEA